MQTELIQIQCLVHVNRHNPIGRLNSAGGTIYTMPPAYFRAPHLTSPTIYAHSIQLSTSPDSTLGAES